MMSKIESLSEYNGIYIMYGVCACGMGASMEWSCRLQDGSVIPRCGKCARGDKSGRYAKIDKDMFDYFTAMHVMTA